ncbi:hypothetical protein GT755_12490 [Herbidospora sp. NEAU-GS84]|uniref:Uncharacterized protein n=1 Tax=Herbidospora solisilvae TaxID=2696284 RepID=A0A7C9JC38_9ACTN|nr:hypothetical protein [Herbidospora solisilvae]NAS22501.1 hypothetical protein [Herbidospora solisilvae]
MTRNDDENGGANVFNFPRVFMPSSFDTSDSPGPRPFAGGERPADAWPELPWANEMAPPPTLTLPAVPSPRELAEDDGAFSPVAMEDPDNPTARETVQLAMALVTAMGVAAAQGMWHRARQRQAQADRARANADKAGGRSASGSSGGSGAPRGGGAGGTSRSRQESPSGRRPSGGGGGTGPSSRPGDRRPPGRPAASPSGGPAPKADKDGKRQSQERDSKSKSLARKLAKAERRGRKKARRKLKRANTEPCIQNETPDTTTEQSDQKKRDKKRRRGGDKPGAGSGRWRWKAAPKDPANADAQPELTGRKRWKRAKAETDTTGKKKRWFRSRRRGESSGDRRERRRERDGRRKSNREQGPERRRRRWWRATPDWLARWRRRREEEPIVDSGPSGDGDQESWRPWEEWMRPPPWTDQADHFEVEVEVVRPEPTQRQALEPSQLQLPPAETPHHQEGTPSMATTPVKPTQYGDAELTVYDVIDADADMADEITAGVDEARATVAGCELLMTRLEMLHAKVVELKVPGVLAGMVTTLMEITLTVKAKAETIAAKLPAAAEAIRTAGANAEARHRPLADAVRDAGHTRPAEREYHGE